MRNPFKRQSEADKRAATARSDLEAARAQLGAIDAEVTEALLNDNVRFVAHSTKRAAAVAEIDRLQRLSALTEAAAADAGRSEADEARRREMEAARQAADILVKRIHSDGPKAMAALLSIAKECAAQALTAKRLNEDLRDNEIPVPVAEIIARDHGAEARENLKSRVIDLWVVADDGRLIGDQGAVSSSDGVTGQLHLANAGFRYKCVRREFRETEFHPATLPDWPAAFSSCLRLPDPAGPGALFDGSVVIPEMVADLDVAQLLAPRKRQPRPVQVELVPVDPSWPPPADVEADADQNAP